MSYSIKSRILGKTLTFSQPGSRYIFVDLNGQPGSLGLQICRGGLTNGGDTIACDEANFERVCKGWYRQWMKVISTR